MNKFDFGENCLLTRHLAEISTLDCGYKAQFAGALLCASGYPHYIQSPNVTIISQLVQEIAKTKRIEILTEATNRCGNCLYSESCEVGALFNRL